MSNVYKEKFDKWANDAESLLDGSDYFLPQHDKSDEVSEVLFILDTLVQVLLQLVFKSFSTAVQQLL